MWVWSLCYRCAVLSPCLVLVARKTLRQMVQNFSAKVRLSLETTYNLCLPRHSGLVEQGSSSRGRMQSLPPLPPTPKCDFQASLVVGLEAHCLVHLEWWSILLQVASSKWNGVNWHRERVQLIVLLCKTKPFANLYQDGSECILGLRPRTKDFAERVLRWFRRTAVLGPRKCVKHRHRRLG